MSKTLLQRNTRYLLLWLPVVLLGCTLLFFVPDADAGTPHAGRTVIFETGKCLECL
ncbi:MAG: hypothetical protein KGM16_06960 [Bacteroidota bacterium]|nr:hypothetical protein [Bacteroidota bacterium]